MGYFRGFSGRSAGRSVGSRRSSDGKTYHFDEQTLRGVRSTFHSSSGEQLPTLKQVDDYLTSKLKEDPMSCKAVYECFLEGIRAYGKDFDAKVERDYLNKYCGYKV